MATNDDDKPPGGTQGKIDNAESPMRSEIRLPSAEYKLFCWKVRQGAPVRKGETIALAVKKVAAVTVSTAEASPSAAAAASADKPSAQFKRPNKRRRLAPPTSAATSAAVTTDTKEHPAKEISKSGGGLLRKLVAASKPKETEMEKTDEKPPASSPTNASTSVPLDSTAEQKSSDNDTSFATAITNQHKPDTNHGAESERIPIMAETDGIIRFGKPATQTDALVIGSIVACEHPTVIYGLCAVCGQQMGRKDDGFNPTAVYDEEDLAETSEDGLTRVTVAGGVTMEISASEGQRMAQQDAERLRKLSKLSLVLDLDHTLLHATNDIRARNYQGREDVRTLILPMHFEPQPSHKTVWVQHFVKLRPHVREFLESASSMYEVGVYTAGTRQYAEQVTMLLARHMVGSRMDQVDMDHLRHSIANVEQQLQRQEQEAQQQKQKDDANAEGTSKRRVRFGETTERTDTVTIADLEKLREELAQACSMEQKALEYRQRLFGARIVSRTDVADLGVNVKSLKRVFPCGGSMAVVVDDREDVWANAMDNETAGEPPDSMLLVRPYHWQPFAGFAEVNNQSGDDFGADAMENDQQQDDDKQLLWTVDILRRIHEAYYEVFEDNPQPGRRTVPEILRDLRSKVLKNTRIVLSSLVPLHRQQASHLPRPQYVRHAENLGATLLPNVTPDVTHVVAAKDGTDKIMAARRIPGCHIVKPLWLMECVWTLTRRDVRPHLWPTGKAPPPSTVRAINSSEENGESETNGEEGSGQVDRSSRDEEDSNEMSDEVKDDEDDDYDEDDLMAELEGDES